MLLLGSVLSSLSGCGAYHPDGYLDPAAHGAEAKLGAGIDAQGGDCRECHGADLASGPEVACGDCHPGGAAWTTDCTFCHGEAADGTGAPPVDLDGTDDPAGISFPAHRAHVGDGSLHEAYDCTSCHTKPDSALTAGHLFDDDTPGRAEVAIAEDGEVSGGRYDEEDTTCRVACHGDGLSNGRIAVDAGPVACGDCHEAAPLTGQHFRHQLEGLLCAECHPGVADDGASFDEVKQHVDGGADVRLPDGMEFTRSSRTCSGSCHGELHSGRTW